MSQTREKTWIDGAEACRILELPKTSNVERLVAEGLVGVRRIPGTKQIYRREDCVNLARLSVRPATATPAED